MTQAEAEKIRKIAEAEKIRKIAEAETAVVEAMGKAEAERLKLKTETYQKSRDAAKKALVLKAPPQIAAKTSASLTKVGMRLQFSVGTSEVNWLLAGLPASVQALTSVTLSKVALIKDASGAQVGVSCLLKSFRSCLPFQRQF